MVASIVERSTTAADWVDPLETDEWTDLHSRNQLDQTEDEKHLVKMRVAGSNPVAYAGSISLAPG